MMSEGFENFLTMFGEAHKGCCEIAEVHYCLGYLAFLLYHVTTHCKLLKIWYRIKRSFANNLQNKVFIKTRKP
jgi:hypothetical protein